MSASSVPGDRPAGSSLSTASSSDTETRPNILLILADDLGWANLGCYGAPHISTPHLDHQARYGIRFTDGYSASALCSPTRFSLYTGRHPGRTPGGLAEPINDHSQGLDPAHPTLASLLRDAGYATALIGKWHCGALPDYSPTKSGWDEFFGNYGGGLEFFSKLDNFGNYDLYEGDAEYQDLRYYTQVLTERAQEYVRREHDRPWLLNLNYTTPHWPWLTEGDEAEGARIAERLRAGDPRALWHADGGTVDKYREMVEDLDRSVNALVEALRETGQERDTLLLFTSDNGGERFSYHWPLYGDKGTLNEGGIRVPTILNWPARMHSGRVSDVPVSSADWTATLLEIAGAQQDPGYPMDGISLAGHVLNGEAVPERSLFWRIEGERALRRGNWKYYRDREGVDHLFDLATDIREQADRAQAEPELLAELRAEWEKTDAELLPYPA